MSQREPCGRLGRITAAALLFAAGHAPAAEEPAATTAAAVAAPESASQPAAAQPPALPACALRVPAGELVSYRGSLSRDSAGGGPATILYPAPGVAGLLGAVLAHALIQNGIESAEQKKAREEADKVLGPYQPVIGGFTTRDLMQRGAALPAHGFAMSLSDSTPLDGWTIETVPSFTLTQDSRGLVLDNVVAVAGPGQGAYRNTVRVVSVPRTEADVTAHWLAEQGERLKAESAGLLAESFRAALADARRSATLDAVPAKTYRYMEGAMERMERGQLVEAGCERIVIKTLRGWLLSIPVRRPADASGCTATAQAS